jgi:hypothetical protein
MPDGNTSGLWSALLSGVLSGVLVSVLGYVFTKRKTSAEIAKLEAETKKIQRELENIPMAVSFGLSASTERIIYDSAGRDVGFDFKGADAQLWEVIDGKDQPVSDFGRGALKFETGGVLSIQRFNTVGRYEVWLERYFLEGKELLTIRPNELMTGHRGFRLSFEAKVIGGEHTLRILLKNEKSNKWVGREQRSTVTTNSWTPIKVYFQIPPTEECRLRLDDLDVLHAPSSIQIRNLLLAEKV